MGQPQFKSQTVTETFVNDHFIKRTKMKVGKEFILGPLSGTFRTTTEKKSVVTSACRDIPYNATLYSIHRARGNCSMQQHGWLSCPQCGIREAGH